MEPLTINGERLWDSLRTMAQIGATPRGGVCRLALTDVDRQGRDLFVHWAREAGCTVNIDQMGNVIARRAGLDNSLPPVMTESHLDSQPTGGKFDGVYGVLAGLEVIRTLNNHGLSLRIQLKLWCGQTKKALALPPLWWPQGSLLGSSPSNMVCLVATSTA
jgi:N-carbamoyl-L-amino-acid hydrolase